MSIRQFSLFMGAFAISLSVGLARGADETYDLRGPAPKKGQGVKATMKFNMKGADFAVTVSGTQLNGKMDMFTTTEKEAEVLGVDGRNITKLRTKINKDEMKRKTSIAGMDNDETENKELAGETIISELVEKKWKHTLEDAKPNEKQQKALAKFDNPENDDNMYPAEKVKVGHAWTIEGDALKKIVGQTATDIKGTGKAKFLRTEKVAGELCAVIEMEFDVKAKMKEDKSEGTIEMKGKTISFRSIEKGFSLKSTIEGSATVNLTTKENDMEVQVRFSGKVNGDSTAQMTKGIRKGL